MLTWRQQSQTKKKEMDRARSKWLAGKETRARQREARRREVRVLRAGPH